MGDAIDTIPAGLGEAEWKKVKFVDQGHIMTFRCKESDKYSGISRAVRTLFVFEQIKLIHKRVVFLWPTLHGTWIVSRFDFLRNF